MSSRVNPTDIGAQVMLAALIVAVSMAVGFSIAGMDYEAELVERARAEIESEGYGGPRHMEYLEYANLWQGTTLVGNQEMETQ